MIGKFLPTERKSLQLKLLRILLIVSSIVLVQIIMAIVLPSMIATRENNIISKVQPILDSGGSLST